MNLILEEVLGLGYDWGMLSTAQIKLNLPMEMKVLAEEKAKRFGLTLSSYLRFLLLNEIKVEDYPVYRASERVERSVARAKKAEKEGRLIWVDNVDDFFDKLKG